MTVKKSALKQAGFVLSGLFVFIVGPMVSVDAAEDTCDDGFCDGNAESNDLKGF